MSWVPTELLSTLTGTNLYFEWPAEYTGWVLQYQTNSLVSNAWKDLPASTLTNAWEISTLPEVDSAFFRLRFP